MFVYAAAVVIATCPASNHTAKSLSKLFSSLKNVQIEAPPIFYKTTPTSGLGPAPSEYRFAEGLGFTAESV